MGSYDDDGESTFRQRLWGAAVLIATLVIVLPLLLDGAGSESQFRRVEKLRQEPPRIIDAEGNRKVQVIPEMRSARSTGPASALSDRAGNEFVPDIRIGEDDPPDYMKAEQEVRESLERNRGSGALTAWVVQAGSFVQQENALAVRDSLRRAGFASFVRNRTSETDPYRVLVGPMISQESAEAARLEVVRLLEHDAIIMSYP